MAKLNFGPGEDPPGTKQYNYDLGSLRKSTATTKPAGGKDGNRESAQGERRPRPAAAGRDDDFEMVTDKKKPKKDFNRGGNRGGF